MVNSIGNSLVKIDNICDYIPVASTVNNLINLFQKCVVLPLTERASIANSHYYTHLQQKSFLRCIFLLIPVLGNIIIGIYDFANMKYSDRDVVLAAVQRDGSALQYASEQLKGDRDVVLAAVQRDG